LKDFDRGEVGAAKTAEEERARVEKIIQLSSRILISLYTSFAFRFCQTLMFLLSIFVAPLCFCYPFYPKFIGMDKCKDGSWTELID